MPNLVPETWKDSAESVRDNVMEAFDRWMPRWVSERRALQKDQTWPASFFAHGGPAVDVVEEDDAIRVTAELAGLSEKDFTVELRDNRLVIQGEKKASRKEDKRNHYYSECSYGSFSRTIPLPCEVEGDKVVAKYKHGVLTVTLPKTAAAKTCRVKVEVS